VLPLLRVIADRWPSLSVDFAFVFPAEEHAGSQHYSQANGWSEPQFASGLPHLRGVLGAVDWRLGYPIRLDRAATRAYQACDRDEPAAVGLFAPRVPKYKPIP
jgi:hypothetical protein